MVEGWGPVSDDARPVCLEIARFVSVLQGLSLLQDFTVTITPTNIPTNTLPHPFKYNGTLHSKTSALTPTC